ncbi:O-antigen ligase family protein [Clostridium perfringens]|nr:O-antigen ligase family protein [Clostridium perfringens]
MSYVEVKNNNKSIFYRLVTLILTILYISNIFSETTAFLMLMVYIGEIFLNKKILDSINSKRYIFYVVIIGILIFTFFNKDTINQFLAKKDANYWWRFNYWATEFKTLKESYFIGSGFGSTYASTSIFEILSGGFIDPETGTFVNSAKVLFTTAQHNSYMNIIYRTGIIGLILFLNIIVSLIFNYKKYLINNYDRLLYLAFINVNIIIGFNVGLESPQFLIPFYLSLFGLMSLEKKYKNEKKY